MAETPYTACSYLEGGLMAVINAFAQDAVDRAEPLTVAAAYAQCRDAALAESAIGAVGLEIESYLVNLDHVADPVPWKRVEAIAAMVGKVAPGSAVTVEPGGQIELSGPPEAGVAPAVARLRYEGTGARLALADRRLGLAYAGADPARPSRRVNPRPRYRAMEQHFAATGRAAAGRVMMNSTAALQVNLQAPADGRRPRRAPEHAVPAGPAPRLPGSAVPRHVRAAVVAGDRGRHHHTHGRPGRGRSRDRGDRAGDPTVDRGGQGRARELHAGRVRAALPGDRRRARAGRAHVGGGRPR